MATNEKQHDREIRASARRMWQEAGSAKGREDDYGTRPPVAGDRGALGRWAVGGISGCVGEEAELLENLGECPGPSD